MHRSGSIIRWLVTFLRKGRRLTLIAATIVWETFFLNATVGRKPSGQRLLYRAERQRVACRRVLRIWKIDVEISDSVPAGDTALMVSNHLGIVDSFVVAANFPVSISGKAELMWTPVVGWVCRSIAMIPVYRRQRLRTTVFAEEVRARLAAGVNVLVFPEGTTVRGTEVRPFKTGGFAAIEGDPQQSVLPTTLVVKSVNGRAPDSDAHSMFTWTDPTQSLFSHLWTLLGLHSATVSLVVGDRIRGAGKTRKQLAERCHKVISEMSQAQALHRSAPEPTKPPPYDPS